jgi:cell wall-associated NlpC family hydrolase
MRKLLMFLVLLGLVEACSNVYYEQGEEGPASVRIPDDYVPKNVKHGEERQTLIKQGEKLIGTKYRYGGTTTKGFDCSGFTSYVYNKIDVNLTRSSQSQSKEGSAIKLKEVAAGDLVFFKTTSKNRISHVAMVVSNDAKGITVIHSTTSKGVRKDNISKSSYWKPRILFARRILD